MDSIGRVTKNKKLAVKSIMRKEVYDLWKEKGYSKYFLDGYLTDREIKILKRVK